MVYCGEGSRPEDQLAALQREAERRRPKIYPGTGNLGAYLTAEVAGAQQQRQRELRIYPDEAERMGLTHGQEVPLCNGPNNMRYTVVVVDGQVKS